MKIYNKYTNKKSKALSLLLALVLLCVLGGCGKNTTSTQSNINVENGTYLADFSTDSSMFHVNEVWNGKGILTVEDGVATIHIVMPSKNIVNLYLGLAEAAKDDSENLISPVVEEVTYSDGLVEEVYAFDVPVPCIDEEYDLALIGKKQVWYDHKVIVSNLQVYSQDELAVDEADEGLDEENTESVNEDFYVNVFLTGGSGKATVESPSLIKVNEAGEMLVEIKWSSPYYDYMIVDGDKFLPINEEGNSVFEIPIKNIDNDIVVVADTVAMSKPHEIEYTLSFEKVTE